MRKKLLIILAISIGIPVLIFAGTVTKGLIGKQDISLWNGTSTRTFTRESSEGYTLTLNQLDWVGVDVFQTYGGGAARNDTTLTTALSSVGSSNEVGFWFAPGTWSITDDITITSNIMTKVPAGAVFSISSGKTLTINGPFKAGAYQVFSGSGTVVFSNPGLIVYPEWWDIDGTADEVQINYAIDAITAVGGIVELSSKTYVLDDAVVMKDDVTLRGHGRKTILQVPDSDYSGNQLLTNNDWTDGNSDIKISDLTIKVTAADPYTGSGKQKGSIIFFRVNGLTIEKIYTDSYLSDLYCVDLWAGNRNITVEGCQLTNTQTATSGGALQIRGGNSDDANYDSYDISIVNNILRSDKDEALALLGWMNTISNVTISGNIVDQSDDISMGISGGDTVGHDGLVTDIIISGNQFQGTVSFLTGVSRVNFSGNSIVSATSGVRPSIQITDASALAGSYPSDITISNNYIYNALLYGININGTRINVSGNHINGSSGDPSGRGIFVDEDATYAVVRGNYIYNSFVNGIKVYKSTNAVIQGNYIHTAGTTGIILEYDTSGAIVNNNVVHEAATYGIHVDDAGESLSDITINNNEIVRVGTAMTNGIRVEAGTYSGCEASYNRVEGATTNYNLPTTNIWISKGNKNDSLGDKEQITADGATLQTWGGSELDSTDNKVDSTLGSGTYVGQIKTIVMTEASNSSTVTITNHQTSDPEVATFNAVDETGIFEWTGTEWITIFATCTF